MCGIPQEGLLNLVTKDLGLGSCKLTFDEVSESLLQVHDCTYLLSAEIFARCFWPCMPGFTCTAVPLLSSGLEIPRIVHSWR